VVLHGAPALPAHASSLIEIIRTQAELRALMSFEVHTEETMKLGRELECTKKYGKSFDFPKMHMLVHCFDDIWAKGASANFSTKPCEQMHGRLRHAYGTSSKRTITVDSEILHKTHAAVVYGLIEAEVKDWEEFQQRDAEDSDEDEPDNEEQVYHIHLGTKDRSLSTDLLEMKHADNSACRRLSRRICDCIKELDPACLQAGETIKVTECHYLRIHYESMVDWCLYRDKLRCSPMVYGKPRYDCVLVDHEDGIRPARLLLLLECGNSADPSKIINIALVSYFNPILRQIGAVERATGFRRYRQHTPAKSELIPLRSVIRGALLVPLLDPVNKDDYLANDLIDTDIYKQVRPK
ncbi:hypothetical protein FRC09_011965, partial [Ceratobasidium sp. 395]